MNLVELIRDVQFKAGTYQIECVLGDKAFSLLEFEFTGDDEAQGRNLPNITSLEITVARLRTAVANALVRAGARHPGLDSADVASLHALARKHHHIELFVDINALVHGLATQVANSLGQRVARVVASSSSVDVLHEYQSFSRKHHDGSPAIIESWELARGLRVLRELRAPVHVHQLAPGAARYFRRSRADSRASSGNSQSDEHAEETTYVSEDRQMIAAFWDYLSHGGPRIPIVLVTADLSLAHVCAAEKLPFVFAKAPREEANPLRPDSLWFDPFALCYRTCTAQAILWELCLVLGTVNVRVVNGAAGFQEFGLRYEPRNHRPGTQEDLQRGPLAIPVPPVASTPGRGTTPPPSRGTSLPRSSGTDVPDVTTRPTSVSERVLKLSIQSIVDVLPASVGQLVPFSSFRPRDADSIRQLWQIGAQTRLYSQDGQKVVAGDELPKLLAALKAGDYIEVNRVFRSVPGYDRVVAEAQKSGVFPSSRVGGAATGWAIVLGAAYKLPGSVTYGLDEITDEQFESAVTRAHAEFSDGQSAVLLARVLDRVCNERRISPIRFESLLNRTLGQRGLRDFEAQRALSKAAIPAHQVLVSPATSAPSSYLRKLSPGEGIVFGGKLVGSLVRRTGRQ